MFAVHGGTLEQKSQTWAQILAVAVLLTGSGPRWSHLYNGNSEKGRGDSALRARNAKDTRKELALSVPLF